MMDAGKLRHRIRIEKPVDTFDLHGQRIRDWTEHLSCWAEVRPTGSNERLIANQMQSGQTHVITARWQALMAEVDGEFRIIFKDRLFNIVGRPRNVQEKNEYIVFDTADGSTADAR